MKTRIIIMCLITLHFGFYSLQVFADSSCLLQKNNSGRSYANVGYCNLAIKTNDKDWVLQNTIRDKEGTEPRKGCSVYNFASDGGGNVAKIYYNPETNAKAWWSYLSCIIKFVNKADPSVVQEYVVQQLPSGEIWAKSLGVAMESRVVRKPSLDRAGVLYIGNLTPKT